MPFGRGAWAGLGRGQRSASGHDLLPQGGVQSGLALLPGLAGETLANFTGRHIMGLPQTEQAQFMAIGLGHFSVALEAMLEESL